MSDKFKRTSGSLDVSEREKITDGVYASVEMMVSAAGGSPADILSICCNVMLNALWHNVLDGHEVDGLDDYASQMRRHLVLMTESRAAGVKH